MMNILIVSPSESDVRWINNILGEAELNTADSCSNTTDAVQLLSVNKYDLVLSEAFLPVLTGFDLKKLMDSFGYSIPMLLFTEKLSESTKKEAKYAGMIDCLATDHLDTDLFQILDKISGVKA